MGAWSFLTGTADLTDAFIGNNPLKQVFGENVVNELQQVSGAGASLGTAYFLPYANMASSSSTPDPYSTNANGSDKNGINYPGNDPTVSPGDDWEWRGPQDKGSWYNPNTGETLHPDLDHPYPPGPHWDYIPYKKGPQYRIMPDDTIELK